MKTPVPLIDRQALVRRHNVVLTSLDPKNPLTVGNGEFAFTADATGLQTFPELYEETIPLCTQSQWGWHSFPMPEGLSADQFRYAEFDTHGRSVGYAVDAKGQEQLFHHLRESPHRLHLGRIALALRHADGRPASPSDLTNIRQALDLWTGRLRSEFTFANEQVTVETCCAGDRDGIGVRVSSTLVTRGLVAVTLAFPYGSPAMNAADWSKPQAHETQLARPADDRGTFTRTLHDNDRYHAALAWSTPATLEQEGAHTFVLRATNAADAIEFVCVFAADAINEPLPRFDEATLASEQFWSAYWQSGAALEFTGSTDPRAHELERRVVLSQYLLRINSAGSIPPAETGITCNSWYGKPHLEMHWWHGVHFALWDRLPLLEKSLSWYERIMPVAKAIAERQGYAGVRWPKMVGPDGTDSPSPVASLLLWQQPHPIYYAELCYRAKPTRETLSRWANIVEQTAAFMASFLVFDEATGQYVLGPPMKTVSENNDPRTTKNAAFELSYWRFGLRVAQAWRERLGQSRREEWDDRLARMAPLPQVEGCYAFQDDTPDTYTKWNWEHPALLGVRGALPGDGTDAAVHRRTVERVMSDWQWDRCWGWDFPMTAMGAARAGRPDLAVDALFIESKKNTYSIAGHNYQRPNLPLYLPGNGGLLAAVAMMAAGWDGSSDDAPGFPKSGWVVRHEGFKKMLAVDGDAR